MAETPKKHYYLELGIEFCLELAIGLYQLGAEQMDLPHNFWVGLALWVAATALAVRMFWIFPGIERLNPKLKAAIAAAGIAALIFISWTPVTNAYRKSQKPVLAQATSEPSPQPGSEQSPAPKLEAPPEQSKPKPHKPTPKVSQDSHGDNSPNVNQNSQGANSPNIQQEGQNNIAQPGNGNTVIINSTPPSPSFHEKTDAEDFNFSFGEHGITVTQSIAWIRAHAFVPFLFGSYAPVTVTMKDDKILFDFRVWGGEGKPPVEVKNNDFTVRVPVGWDRNSSDNALEVVNADSAPVFQMIRKNLTDIVVNGAFPTPTGVILAGSGPTITGARPEDLRNFHLKPLFKYPSWKYPGQYAE